MKKFIFVLLVVVFLGVGTVSAGIVERYENAKGVGTNLGTLEGELGGYEYTYTYEDSVVKVIVTYRQTFNGIEELIYVYDLCGETEVLVGQWIDGVSQYNVNSYVWRHLKQLCEANECR